MDVHVFIRHQEQSIVDHSIDEGVGPPVDVCVDRQDGVQMFDGCLTRKFSEKNKDGREQVGEHLRSGQGDGLQGNSGSNF